MIEIVRITEPYRTKGFFFRPGQFVIAQQHAMELKTWILGNTLVGVSWLYT